VRATSSAAHGAGRSVGCHRDHQDDPDHLRRDHRGRPDVGHQSHPDVGHPSEDDRGYPCADHRDHQDERRAHPDVGRRDHRGDRGHPCADHQDVRREHQDVRRDHPDVGRRDQRDACWPGAAGPDDRRPTADVQRAAAGSDDRKPRWGRGGAAEAQREELRQERADVPEEPADAAHRWVACRRGLRDAARASVSDDHWR